ncbi:MAG: alpha-hydroxy-acid oxidizing protein [Clostridia bacterium]|nr:alpha-hydroxy-acid oxidizing protein [Clostridia bacterium]
MTDFHPSDANMLARRAFDEIQIEERLISSGIPSLDFDLFGKRFKTPIMTPAFSHLPVYGEGRANGMIEYARAAKALGAVNWVGMCENPDYREIAAVGAETIRIVKPYADLGKIRDQIRFAEEVGSLAVGIDIDHSFSGAGKADLVVGETMTCLSADQIADFVSSTRLPFILKGVLSARDARLALDAGCRGVVVSHHHGRLPYAVAPITVLPSIRKEVGNGLKLFVDCSVDRGADAFKAVALGADAVSVGRAMWPALQAEGEKGLCGYIERMNDELRMCMAFTSCRKLSDAEPSMLWKNGVQMG